MTEDEARHWCQRFANARAMERLEQFAARTIDENSRQNLISPGSCDHIWSRHIADSAQLLSYVPAAATSWVDVGSGPGLPGLVIAILCDLPITLIEPRTRRVTFLNDTVTALGLSNVSVRRAKAEAVTGTFDVISARAVAGIPQLLVMTRHLSQPSTRLILPRGRNGAREVAELPTRAQRMFHVEQSVTDAESVIVIADGVTS